MSKLIVYKASAGSGKTFRLAAEYLKLVLTNPLAYRRILAVTFTNKATGEMKSRILGELFLLSTGEPSGLAKEVSRDLGLSLGVLSEKAKVVLGLILHDYSRFSVSTIDSFVQRVVQGLLWEIGQEGNFDLEMDEQAVLEKAVDTMLDSAASNPTLLEWLYRMSRGRVSEGQSWDVRDTLIGLGRQLFNESFRTMDQAEVADFTSRDKVNQLRHELEILCRDVARQLSALGSSAVDAIDRSGLSASDLVQGAKGPYSFFHKVEAISEKDEQLPEMNSYVRKALEDSSMEAWCSGPAKKDVNRKGLVASVASGVLHPSLVEINNLYNERGLDFHSAQMLLKNLDTLALLGDIWNTIRVQSKEEGFLLISDTAMLLRNFVKDSDTPFVYEKTGMRYSSYMIDEFQDTSVVQWENFLPLIVNSLAEDEFSMVVGDVKQSIYRWRSGDWRILSEGVERDLATFGVDVRNMDRNFRSLPEVVNFNNHFFTRAVDFATDYLRRVNKELSSNLAEHFGQELQQAYAGLEQKSTVQTKDGNGYVRVDLLPATGRNHTDEEVALELPLLIEQLQQRGYAPGDIAILVRSNSDGQKVANTLLAHKRANPGSPYLFDVVSQDGLRLSASPVVRLCLAALSLVVNPADGVAKGVLLRELSTVNSPNEDAREWHSCFTGIDFGEIAEWLTSLRTLPVQEALEEVINHFSLFQLRGELAFLAELHEQATSFSRKGHPDIAQFVQWWKEKGVNVGLSVPEKKTAITILTIHRSKGLQFPVVIIPYFSWPIMHSSGTFLWVSHSEPPFNLIPKYPIKTSKLAEKSHFAAAVAEEKLRALVDTLNMVYVAFTRPERELYVFAPARGEEKIGGNGSVNDAAQLLDEVLFSGADNFWKKNNGVTVSGEEITRFEVGEPQPVHFQLDSAGEHSIPMTTYPTGAVPRGIRLNLEAIDFFLPEPSERSKVVGYGKLMHELLASIETEADLPAVIDRFVREGRLSKPEKLELLPRFQSKLALAPFTQWFSKEFQVLRETTILTPDGKSYRPDRVMVKGNAAIVVDFKFGHEDAAHAVQVRRYATLLMQMGYNPVEGFIWYVDGDKVVSAMG